MVFFSSKQRQDFSTAMTIKKVCEGQHSDSARLTNYLLTSIIQDQQIK